ncbi:MAG: diacylglycerol/lipid kinase family protein [Leadbetterella sp.]
MKEPIFIINPISGSKKIDTVEVLRKLLPSYFPKYLLLTTTHKGHATEIIEEYIQLGYDTFIAVGGDGTINEVAKALIHKDATLGIIPKGSGNGLARSLGIPIHFEGALRILKNNQQKKIDVGMINNIPFLCTAGVGFDAKCAHDFNKSPSKRGLWNYVRVCLNNFFSYLPIRIDEGNIEKKVYSLTIANAPQYGNETYIAPKAKLDDGLLDITTILPHSKWKSLALTVSLFTRKIYRFEFVHHQQLVEYSFRAEKPTELHIDGEANTNLLQDFKIEIQKKAICVIHNQIF